MPGELERVVWAGGDSTLTVIGTADWDAKVYGIIEVERVVPPLARLAHMDEDDGEPGWMDEVLFSDMMLRDHLLGQKDELTEEEIDALICVHKVRLAPPHCFAFGRACRKANDIMST